MTDNKMTESEVMKALKICTTYGAKCTDCPAYVKVDRSKCKEVLKGAVEIINSKNAEIEKLQKLLDDKCDRCIAKERVEAYREFAKFLIDKAENGVISIVDLPEYVIEMEGKVK